jgi:hypothetical protein
MKLHEFKSYEEYAETQISLSRRKVNRISYRCFTLPEVIRAIRTHYVTNVKKTVEFGLCHGVRKGEEVDMLATAFGTGYWIGTEITPELCDGEKILHRDFDQVDQDWIGKFDVIYSNSLDHSRNPWKTLRAWIACLAPHGRLFVEWTAWHNKLGRGNKADCFAADEHHYAELLDRIGHLVSTVPVTVSGNLHLIFVVK